MRGVSIIEAMVIDMNEAQVRTLEQVRQVVAGTQALRRFDYRQLGRADKGAVLACLQHLSGYSRGSSHGWFRAG